MTFVSSKQLQVKNYSHGCHLLETQTYPYVLRLLYSFTEKLEYFTSAHSVLVAPMS